MTQSTSDANDASLDYPASKHSSVVLSAASIDFLRDLATRFDDQRLELLAQRESRQQRFDAGELPDFLEDTQSIRDQEWRVAPIPEELLDRRIEITGPVDRKMIINALNSDARVFMADFEDSSSPTWDNMIDGQQNLIDAVRGTIEHRSPEGKRYALNPNPAILMVRPRGLHLSEDHLTLNGNALGASLVDAGLFLFHNASELIRRGLGPCLYLPKLEHYREARWWRDVLRWCEERLQLERGTIKTTVLIETLPAAFQMDEILYQLRDHMVALNCGRWDYIFSYIKVFRNHSDRVLPDRSQLGMGVEFLNSYSLLLVRTCHRRGALAMGGMAAQIPVKNDAAANALALRAVSTDKQREVANGHDGTWVAHPGLIPIAREAFDSVMTGPNQLDRPSTGDAIGRDQLLAIPPGTRSEQGGRANADVAIRYLASWLDGQGCVPIHHLMEDAATAEISRSQLWQWAHHTALLNDGSAVDAERIRGWIDDALSRIEGEIDLEVFQAGRYGEAADLLDRMVRSDSLADFLTLLAYPLLDEEDR